MTVWSPDVVVVGVDGSEQSLRAARTAAGLVRASGGKLVIATVVRPPEGWWGVVGSPPPADVLADALVDAQRRILDETVGALDLEGVDYETDEEIGDPAAMLIRVCEEYDADVLVIGKHGGGMLRRLVLGSVAHHLVHEAPVPVLLVP